MATSIYIDAPVETVFRAVKDPRFMAEYALMGTQYDEVKETRQGTGTYFSWHSTIAGIRFGGFDVYSDVVPNKHITEKSSNALVGTWEYSFEPEGAGTRVTMEHHPRSIWGLPPLRNLVDLVTDRTLASFAPMIKEHFESTGTKPAKSA